MGVHSDSKKTPRAAEQRRLDIIRHETRRHAHAPRRLADPTLFQLAELTTNGGTR